MVQKQHEYFFKAEIRFICPTCKRESVETVIASDLKHDHAAVARAIEKRVKPIVCQNCKTVCPDGVQVNLGMNDLTADELAKIKVVSARPGRSKIH